MINQFIFVVSYSHVNDDEPKQLYSETFDANYEISDTYHTESKLLDMLADYNIAHVEWDVCVNEYECTATHTIADGVCLIAEIYALD